MVAVENLRQPMTPSELRTIQSHLAELEAVLAKSHGGWSDEESLLEFQRICAAILLVVQESSYRERIELLLQYAKGLYSDRAHHRWDIGPVFGADILRRKLRMTLSACRARAYGTDAFQPFGSIARGLPAGLLRRGLRASPT